jgi:hypothetical protein
MKEWKSKDEFSNKFFDLRFPCEKPQEKPVIIKKKKVAYDFLIISFILIYKNSLNNNSGQGLNLSK